MILLFVVIGSWPQTLPILRLSSNDGRKIIFSIPGIYLINRVVLQEVSENKHRYISDELVECLHFQGLLKECFRLVLSQNIMFAFRT